MVEWLWKYSQFNLHTHSTLLKISWEFHVNQWWETKWLYLFSRWVKTDVLPLILKLKNCLMCFWCLKRPTLPSVGLMGKIIVKRGSTNWSLEFFKWFLIFFDVFPGNELHINWKLIECSYQKTSKILTFQTLNRFYVC